MNIEELKEVGVLDFEFKNNQEILEVHIFKATKWTGVPQETEEMKPEWFSIDEIPYKDMWSDDKYWLPVFLKNRNFKGRFLFDENDQVLEQKLEEMETQ